ncbi:MAG TPA: pectinesterase family protein [Opitutaceae bacterium]|nr:pectinesterase family protein [Opitutaceae bacterium]
MKHRTPIALLVLLAAAPWRPARAQDNVRGGSEPIVASIDPGKLAYDYLVDGNLPQDDPAGKKFRTLQAAYAAAPAGTAGHPTVIGIRPNVYLLPGPKRGASLRVTKDYITFLGLTNNRRSVVLADNRGLMQGSDDDGFIVDVNATGFTAKNLTFLNYCNNDYEYPGDPSKNLRKRSDVITQGVALQAAGDKHVYENVALLGRLDTMFLRTARSYFKNVYIEGTDDWMGGGQVSVWEDCTLVYAIGHGVMSASNVVFRRCRFEAPGGFEFYKAEFRGAERPDVLIDCVLADAPQGPVAWIRGIAPPRPGQLSSTYHVRDGAGRPARIRDCTVGPATYRYGRELASDELAAYTTWNLLRAAPGARSADNWDPTGTGTADAKGGLPFRVAVAYNGKEESGPSFRVAPPAPPSIRTGGPGASLRARLTPSDAADPSVLWSASSDLVQLSAPRGREISVAGNNHTTRAEWVTLRATAADGIYAPAYVYVEPKYIDAPAVTSGPALSPPAGGKVRVRYELKLDGLDDQSLVSWYICDDARGSHPREVAVSRGDEPLKSLVLTPGYVGKYLKVELRPKHRISDPGPAVAAFSAAPVAASDVPSQDVSPRFRNFVVEKNDTYASGLWTVLGSWSVVTGDDYAGGYGLRPEGPSSLLYQNDRPTGDMEVELTMAPEKTEGTGFSVPGSPADSDSAGRNLHSDIFIKYDPRTRTGYSLRFWRTTQSAAACMYQFYRIVDGVGRPVDGHRVLTGVFKPTTHLTVRVKGATISARASNSHDGETLSLESTIQPNSLGGAGVYWPRGSSNVYSQISISYP